MDIKKAIEKLNSLDAKDLKNIDLSKLKEYNMDRLKQDLSTKPKLLINSILITMTVLSFLWSLNSYRSSHAKIKKEIGQLNQKHGIMQAAKATEEEYKAFLDNKPGMIPNNQLIGKISEFAESANVNITSFSPLNTLESEYAIQYNVNLNVEAKTYQDVINFINTLEESGYTLKVTRFIIKSKLSGAQFGQYKGESEVPVDLSIDISSIVFKNV